MCRNGISYSIALCEITEVALGLSDAAKRGHAYMQTKNIRLENERFG